MWEATHKMMASPIFVYTGITYTLMKFPPTCHTEIALTYSGKACSYILFKYVLINCVCVYVCLCVSACANMCVARAFCLAELGPALMSLTALTWRCCLWSLNRFSPYREVCAVFLYSFFLFLFFFDILAFFPFGLCIAGSIPETHLVCFHQ